MGVYEGRGALAKIVAGPHKPLKLGLAAQRNIAAQRNSMV